MSLGDRERILSAVELALAFPMRDRSILESRSAQEVPWIPASEPWEPLKKELEVLSARFHRVEEPDEFPSIMGSIFEEHRPKRAICWDHPLLSGLGIERLLQEAGVDLVSGQESASFAGQAARADLGITAVECAILESGALMVRAAPGWERSSSLLPPVHVAILTAWQRLRTVGDIVPLWRQWLARDGRLPSAIHLITGPSRTADIELTLVLGAHGPKVLHVVALDERAIPDGAR